MRNFSIECYKTDILNFLALAYKMPRGKIERIRSSFDCRAARNITNEIFDAFRPALEKRHEAVAEQGKYVSQTFSFYMDIFHAKMNGEQVDDFNIPIDFIHFERDEKIDELFKNYKVMAHCFYLINLMEAGKWDFRTGARHDSFCHLYDYFIDVIYPTYLVAPTPPATASGGYTLRSFATNGTGPMAYTSSTDRVPSRSTKTTTSSVISEISIL